MRRYEKPQIDVEMFTGEDILTESGMVFANFIKIAVPKGKENVLNLMTQ